MMRQTHRTVHLQANGPQNLKSPLLETVPWASLCLGWRSCGSDTAPWFLRITAPHQQPMIRTGRMNFIGQGVQNV